MNKIAVGVILTFVGAGTTLCLTASRHLDTVRPNTKVGSVDVGGMTTEEAARTLRVWWEGEKLKKLTVKANLKHFVPLELKPSELGMTLDDVASVQGLPMQDIGGAISTAVGVGGQSLPEDTHPLIFKANGLSVNAIKKLVVDGNGLNHPAKVKFDKGAIVRIPEVATVALDEAKLPAVVSQAIIGDHVVDLPLTAGAKRISDEDLAKITEVVTEFSTHFPTSKVTRCSNIKLASHLIDGTILMPGEQFSFNGVVGRRTLKAGFKLAGVYKNGQHDTGVGGGICQVSTTLYNAALLADLPIHRRSNHSLPVAYVPLGQDATVDYGNLDLVFENNYATPIAVTSYYQPGKLTFRLLGQKQPGLSVKITRSGMRSEPEETEEVQDPKLALGKRKTIRPGSALRSVSTFRLVYKDGQLVKKEPLGHSRYGGIARIVAVGTMAPTAPAAGAVPGAVPPVAPGSIVPSGTGTASLAGGH